MPSVKAPSAKKLSAFLPVAVALLTAALAFAACSNPSSKEEVPTAQGAAIQAFDPDYEDITSSGFKIKSSTSATVSTSPSTGQTAEYAVSKNAAAPITGWQAGLEFTGLDAGTSYHVWARSGARETASINYKNGTAVKAEKTVTTAVSAGGLLDKLNALTAGAAELSGDNTVILTGTVTLNEELEIEEGEILKVNGTLVVQGDGKLTIGGTVDIGAGTWTGSGASVKLTGDGTLIVPSGVGADTLNAIINDMRKIDRGTGAEHLGNVVIRLTPAFYNAAIMNYIAVDPGANDNTMPYTIRGLGNDTTNDLSNTSIPKLGVGMWLANNNVTLEDVSFRIVAVARGLVPAHPWTKNAEGNVTEAYGAALLLARAKNGDGTAGDYLGGSKKITVQNCTVHIVGGLAGELNTGGICVYDSPSDIRILGNTVNATGREGNAAQALAFEDWGDNIQVKNNKLTAKYANQPNLSSLGENDFYSRPASAFFISGFYESPKTGTYKYNAGDISGNVLSYDPTKASVFSFYVSAYPRPLPESDDGSRKGVAAMGSKKFGAPETRWALEAAAAGDYQRLVVGDLINNCLSVSVNGVDKNGFGAVLMYVSYKKPDNIADYNIETYRIKGGKLINIGIYARTLENGDYIYESDIIDANIAVNANGTTTRGTDRHMRYWQ